MLSEYAPETNPVKSGQLPNNDIDTPPVQGCGYGFETHIIMDTSYSLDLDPVFLGENEYFNWKITHILLYIEYFLNTSNKSK